MKFVTFSINISAFAFEREVFAVEFGEPGNSNIADVLAQPRARQCRAGWEFGGSSADACFIRRFDKIEIKATAL